MHQLTLRIADELSARLRTVAGQRGESVNRYAQAVLAAAVDPELAGDEAERLHERLARAGLLTAPQPALGPEDEPSERALRRARRAAGRGRTLSQLVDEGRG